MLLQSVSLFRGFVALSEMLADGKSSAGTWTDSRTCDHPNLQVEGELFFLFWLQTERPRWIQTIIYLCV